VDLRLVEYVLYLAAGVALTLWAGAALPRGLQLAGLGGVALLLQLDTSLASAADLVRALATRLGLVLLLLGALHLVALVIQRRAERPERPEAASRPKTEYEAVRPASGRFPY